MKITEIPQPVTIIARDGWVTCRDASGDQNWRMAAISKYRRMGFIVVDHEGQVWRMDSISIEPPLSAWRAAFSRLLNAKHPVQIDILPVQSDAIAMLKKCLSEAITNGGDLHTQGQSAKFIINAIDKASSAKDVLGVLRRCRIT